jgi:Fur family ferric uptake transcriptional regulator
MTRQREVILEELKKTTSHPTPDEIYQMVRQRLPRISLGTVYRNLEILSESGLIQKLEMAGAQRRFDGNVENHYHIRCVLCNRVADLHAPLIPIREDQFRARTDFEILGHRLEFNGLCPDCRNERGAMAPEPPEPSDDPAT